MSADNWDIPSEDWPPTFGNDDVERFKWGWNELQGASVWKVSGPGDGRPHHNEQLRPAWGRDASPVGGDVVGVATFTPADKDDRGVASIHAYFGEPVPAAIVRWFKDAFPEARICERPTS